MNKKAKIAIIVLATLFGSLPLGIIAWLVCNYIEKK